MIGARIACSRAPGETRLARLDQDRTVDIVILRDGLATAGSIHLGRVVGALPGGAAALVDIGGARPGFLDRADAPPGQPWPPPEGAALLVAVLHEARRAKGAKLTGRVTLASPFAVYSPHRPGIAVSRRMGDAKVRARLTAAAQSAATPGEGVVVRGRAAGLPDAHLIDLIAALRREWQSILAAARTARAPALLHPGADPLAELLADAGPVAVTCDEAGLAERARATWRRLFPGRAPEIELTAIDQPPLFDTLGIEADIDAALEPVVPLPSGARLIIETTAALTAIDVDTGGNAAGAVNVEAAAEIARQVRLRNLSGHMAVDFVPGGKGGLHRAVQALRTACAADPVPVQVVGPSPLGLVELVRDRRRQPLADLLRDDCPLCAGEGRVASAATMALAALRAVLAEGRASRRAGTGLRAAPELIAALEGPLQGAVAEAEAALGHRLTLVADAGLSPRRFETVPG